VRQVRPDDADRLFRGEGQLPPLRLTATFGQILAGWRTDVLVTIDGAGASHDVIDHLTGLNTVATHGKRSHGTRRPPEHPPARATPATAFPHHYMIHNLSDHEQWISVNDLGVPPVRQGRVLSRAWRRDAWAPER
jgi:hypothetical protein